VHLGTSVQQMNRSSIRKQFRYSKGVDSFVRAFGRNGCGLLTGVLLPTGLVSVGPMECANHQSNTVGLCVISEETSKMLMVHRILQDDSYNRQGLCVLTDTTAATDAAATAVHQQTLLGFAPASYGHLLTLLYSWCTQTRR
jgi:hypothetical protein